MSTVPDRPLKSRLLPSGDLVCPACHNLCCSPVAPNPHTGVVEKMLLRKGTCRCPHCPAVHRMDEVARWHNATVYPDDGRYAPGPLFDPVVPPPRIRIWTWQKATAAIPYLAPLVAGLRSAACRVSHLRLVARRGGPSRAGVDLADAEGELESLADEVEAAGVLTHGGPLRGTVLFPSFVHYPGKPPRGLYLIWRDSRDAVKTYAFADLLRAGGDLAECEKEVPKAWRGI